VALVLVGRLERAFFFILKTSNGYTPGSTESDELFLYGVFWGEKAFSFWGIIPLSARR